MSATVQINNVSPIGGAFLVTGFVALAGSYATGGDLLNFAAATIDPTFQGMVPSLESIDCLNLDVWSASGASIGANYTDYDVVLTKVNNVVNPASGIKLKVAALATPGTEHAAGAYESQYTGDLVAFQGIFTKLL